MKVVGIMLTSALLIFPAVTAFQIARGFRNALFIAAAVALVSLIGGILLSLLMDLPTGASIVMFNFAFFIAAFIFNNSVHRSRRSC
jgi:zinc transport system permease protein